MPEVTVTREDQDIGDEFGVDGIHRKKIATAVAERVAAVRSQVFAEIVAYAKDRAAQLKRGRRLFEGSNDWQTANAIRYAETNVGSLADDIEKMGKLPTEATTSEA